MQKFTAILATIAFTAATLTPVAANAQRRDGWDGRHSSAYSCRDGRRDRCDSYYGDRRGRQHRRDRDNDNDAVAAGVLGLVLGVVIASAIANSGTSNTADANRGYYDDYDSRDAYERDYQLEGGDYSQCLQQQRRWDERSGQYIIVNVPC